MTSCRAKVHRAFPHAVRVAVPSCRLSYLVVGDRHRPVFRARVHRAILHAGHAGVPLAHRPVFQVVDMVAHLLLGVSGMSLVARFVYVRCCTALGSLALWFGHGAMAADVV